MEIDSINIARVDIEEIVDLRYAMLRAGLPRDAAYFPGDRDATTVHLAFRDGLNIVACATVLLNQWEGRAACQVRGMAVDAAYQRRGLGGRLLTEIEHVAKQKGVDLVWANARTPAAEFYQKNGWEIVSEMFEIPTAGPHFRMIRRLK